MDMHIGRTIKLIDEALARRVNANLQKHNLTIAQSHMLMALSRSESGVRPLKELEGSLRLAQSTVAGLAARLEKKGLVSSETDANDKRVKLIRLTDAGRAVCECSRQRIDETEQLLASRLTDEETTLLRDMLRRVYEAVK